MLEQNCNHTPCIVRAFRGKPLRRIVVGAHNGIAYILKPSFVELPSRDRRSGVGFPLNDVFRYDDALMDKLSSSFEAGDEDALNELWDSAQLLPV